MIRYLLILLALAVSGPAYAACTNPAVPEGTIIFNSRNAALQYCNDAGWVLAGIGPWNPPTVTFDGTNDWLTTAAGFTNTKKATISLWAKPASLAASMYVVNLTGDRFLVRFNNALGYSLQVIAENVGNTDILDFRCSPAPTVGQWAHYLLSFDLANAGAQSCYVNGVSGFNHPIFTNDTIDLAGASSIRVGAYDGTGALKLNADIAELWIDFDAFIDFTSAANRAKFRSSSGMPMYLGQDGSIPTGAAPEIFLTSAPATWEINKGTAGGFTETGSLSEAPSFPADSIITGACTSPAVPAGVLLYNSDYSVMQYCGGLEWVAMGPVPGTGGAGCTDPAMAEGTIVYNSSHAVLQYCDGTKWIGIGK